MEPDFNKSDRRRVRELADIAWERQLRDELLAIGDAITAMRNNTITPHDVNQLIHQFHNGTSRELYNRYSSGQIWIAVCRAHYDGILSDEDVSDVSEKLRDELRRFAETYRTINGLDVPLNDKNGR